MKESMKPYFIRVDEAIRELEKFGEAYTIPMFQRMQDEGKINLYFRPHVADDAKYSDYKTYTVDEVDPPFQCDRAGNPCLSSELVKYSFGFAEVIAPNPVGSDIISMQGVLTLKDERVADELKRLLLRIILSEFEVIYFGDRIYANTIRGDAEEYSFIYPESIEKHLFLTPADFQKLKSPQANDSINIVASDEAVSKKRNQPQKKKPSPRRENNFMKVMSCLQKLSPVDLDDRALTGQVLKIMERDFGGDSIKRDAIKQHLKRIKSESFNPWKVKDDGFDFRKQQGESVDSWKERVGSFHIKGNPNYDILKS